MSAPSIGQPGRTVDPTTLVIDGLSSGYGSTQVLHDISLQVPRGQVVAVFGRNGVGKTTLLRSVLGLLPLTAGRIELEGIRIDGMPTHRIIRRGVAYAPQERDVFGELTVRTNLDLALRHNDPGRLEEMLEHFPKIRERMSQPAGTLSGGERKMLLAVRALSTATRLAVIDEIAEGVQPNLLPQFRQALTAVRAHGVSVLLVEQHLQFALPVSDSFAVISNGRVVEGGPVSDSTASDIQAHLVL